MRAKFESSQPWQSEIVTQP